MRGAVHAVERLLAAVRRRLQRENRQQEQQVQPEEDRQELPGPPLRRAHILQGEIYFLCFFRGF